MNSAVIVMLIQRPHFKSYHTKASSWQTGDNRRRNKRLCWEKTLIVTKMLVACQMFSLHSSLQAGFSINKGSSAKRHGLTWGPDPFTFSSLPASSTFLSFFTILFSIRPLPISLSLSNCSFVNRWYYEEQAGLIWSARTRSPVGCLGDSVANLSILKNLKHCRKNNTIHRTKTNTLLCVVRMCMLHYKHLGWCYLLKVFIEMWKTKPDDLLLCVLTALLKINPITLPQMLNSSTRLCLLWLIIVANQGESC